MFRRPFSEEFVNPELRLLRIAVIAVAVPPNKQEISSANHLVVEHGASRTAVQSVDDKTVPAVSSPKPIVLLPVDLEVARLAVGVLNAEIRLVTDRNGHPPVG